METTIRFELNGKNVEMLLDPGLNLLSVIRNQFGLTGTKYACGIARCGACSILLDNAVVRSCTLTVSVAEGKKVTTIEGLSQNGKLHPLQEAFIKHDALQCGFCTPGMIMNAYGMLLRNPEPSQQEIINGMQSNLCRCGAHVRIVDAIESASKEMQGGK
ncbi:MAG TPA: (2Fe-2S)-binding protein [Bacteroidales bacterium]|nr:(2Fe-2S)-binding protein [Bacteroidales bacterium]